MDRAVRRVVVYADSRYVDVALSATMPIGILIPHIVDLVVAARGESAARYQLSLPGDIALDPSKTLEQLEIRDGTVLMLTSSSTVLTRPRVDDIAEAVSASLASTDRPLTRQAARLIGALAASGFAALTGWLAVPGELAAANVLLAAAAAATLATVMRVIGCYATVFTALACFATVEAAAAAVGVVTAVPLPAIGAASAVISLLLIEAAAPLSIALARLSSQASPESGGACDDLSAKAIRAKAWLNSLVAAFSASTALGAIGAAAGSLSADSPRWLGITFATIAGGVLLLRARAHPDLTRSAALIAAGIVTLSATLVTAATAHPPHTPYIAAVSTTLAAAALCLGFVTQPTTLSPIGRRSVELLEYLALAVVVPLACWICGLYGAVRGVNLL